MNIQTIFSTKITSHLYNGDLVTLEETKRVLNDPTLSDNDVEEIRDGFRMLTEIIFDKWLEERKTLKIKEQKII